MNPDPSAEEIRAAAEYYPVFRVAYNGQDRAQPGQDRAQPGQDRAVIPPASVPGHGAPRH